MPHDWKNLVCPKCHRFWAQLDFGDYPDFRAKHVKIVWGKRKKMRDGDSLRCTDCGYEYLTADVVLAGTFPEQGDMKPGERKEV